jgi:predicted DNA-binding WGR domain protein
MRKEVYLVNEEANTFFAIARAGTTLQQRWGSLGDDGQHGHIDCSSVMQADFLFDSRIERKLKRGYARA